MKGIQSLSKLFQEFEIVHKYIKIKKINGVIILAHRRRWRADSLSVIEEVVGATQKDAEDRRTPCERKWMPYASGQQVRLRYLLLNLTVVIVPNYIDIIRFLWLSVLQFFAYWTFDKLSGYPMRNLDRVGLSG